MEPLPHTTEGIFSMARWKLSTKRARSVHSRTNSGGSRKPCAETALKLHKLLQLSKHHLAVLCVLSHSAQGYPLLPGCSLCPISVGPSRLESSSCNSSTGLFWCTREQTWWKSHQMPLWTRPTFISSSSHSTVVFFFFSSSKEAFLQNPTDSSLVREWIFQ